MKEVLLSQGLFYYFSLFQVSHVKPRSEAVYIVASDSDSEKPSQELAKNSSSVKVSFYKMDIFEAQHSIVQII